MNLFEDNGASFSIGRKYRYSLWRIWDKEKPLVMFIGLNPSTANANDDDPTIRRVKRFAFDWGFGGVYMMNLFSYVTPYPDELVLTDVSHEIVNDFQLKQVAKHCSEIIFAWGSFKEAKERAEKINVMFPGAKALAINNDGSPKHPLYVAKNITLVNYEK